jgi:hypothetical protein
MLRLGFCVGELERHRSVKIIPAWNPMSLIDRDHFVSDIRAADVTRSDLTALLRATDRCFDSENEWSKNSVIL